MFAAGLLLEYVGTNFAWLAAFERISTDCCTRCLWSGVFGPLRRCFLNEVLMVLHIIMAGHRAEREYYKL
jgi:hypothetical protein